MPDISQYLLPIVYGSQWNGRTLQSPEQWHPLDDRHFGCQCREVRNAGNIWAYHFQFDNKRETVQVFEIKSLMTLTLGRWQHGALQC